MPSLAMAALIRHMHERPGKTLQDVSPGDCARILDVDGICATITDVEKGILAWHIVWCSDDIGVALNDFRCRLVEGPGVHAVLWNTSVLIPSLAAPACRARWPQYTAAALAVGVEAVFAFPLRRISTPYGAIIAHRKIRGAISSVDDATAFTDAAAKVLNR